MKIQIKLGKLVILYIDTIKKNKILLSFIANDVFKKIKENNYIKIIQSRIEGDIELGNYISMTNTTISSSISKVIIRNFCSIAPNVCIIGGFHNYKRISSYYIFSNVLRKHPNNDIITKGDILIEEDVWIGASATILSGVKIGRGSIIGANSVCNRTIDRYSIVAGVPVKVLKKRFSEKKISEIEVTKWWNWDIKKMQKNANFFAENVEWEN